MADAERRLEAHLRQVVAGEITDHQRRAEAEGRMLDTMDQRQIARVVLQRELDLRDREALRQGELPLPPAEREDLAARVLGQVFSTLPGLEPYLRSEVTNVHVMGCRAVFLELLDGTTERHESPYGSPQEVVESVAHMARRGGLIEKPFNFANPMLHMSLADGSRLTANAWIGAEPYVTIRRHPLVDHGLDDLAQLGMFDGELRSFLAAVVRARWNLLIAGGQGNGKTTLLRALAHEAHPDERTLVLESEPELGLDRVPDRHRQVISLWERPGNSEGDGAVDLAAMVWHAKRLSPSRIIVGEVLADEVVPMLEAMSQGVRGSMATIHAESSAAVFPRLPVYARSRGRDWRSADIYALAALALDLVIFVGRDRDDRRVVAEVRHVGRFDQDGEQVVSDAWYLPNRAGQAEPVGVMPVELLDELVAHGYEPTRRPSSGNGAGGRR